MTAARSTSWSRTTRSSLFVGAAVSSPGCVVVAGGAGVSGVGAVVVVALLVPGAVCARVAVLA